MNEDPLARFRAELLAAFLPVLIPLVRLLTRVVRLFNRLVGRPRVCGASSPFGDGPCELPRGHDGAHGYGTPDGGWTGWGTL